MNKIKLFDPSVGKEEEKALIKVLKSHFWASGSGGNNVMKFEQTFRKYVNSDDCVSVNSGTAALNLALSLLPIKNQEVIVPSLTFVSTINSIIINGAKPVFVDIDPTTLCLDTSKIKESITNKTKLILPVHFGGLACNLDEIRRIARSNNISVIEDAAHAAGTSYKNKKIGSHSFAVCFSFHPVKNLAMPGGGLISINHKNFKKYRKDLLAKRWCGITDRVGVNYDVKDVGWNYYMDEFSAGIGIEQLKKLNRLNSQRKKIAKRYFKELDLEKKMPYDHNCAYHFYWIRVKNRKKFRENMERVGIETGIHYKPVHTMSMFKKTVSLPITEQLSQEIVILPTHPNLTQSDINKVIRSVNNFS